MGSRFLWLLPLCLSLQVAGYVRAPDQRGRERLLAPHPRRLHKYNCSSSELHAVIVTQLSMHSSSSSSIAIRVNVSELKALRGPHAAHTIVERDGVVRASVLVPGARTISLPGARAAAAAMSPTSSAAAVSAAAILADGSSGLYLQQTQLNPPNWGLDRIDQRNLPLDGRFVFDELDEAKVIIYVVDSGIRTSHTQLIGRVLPGMSFVDGAEMSTEDCGVGHGSHLAGIAAGTSVGVCKQCRLVSVRVYGCSMEGPLSAVLAGLRWVLRDVQARNATHRSVVNLSFGTPRSPALDLAVQGLVEAGAVVVAAAGNDASDACTLSPAGSPFSITVGSSDPDDTLSSFTNTGACVDIVAPGRDVLSLGIQSDMAGELMSGTSMSSPFAAGAVARFLARHPAATSMQAAAWLACTASRSALAVAEGEAAMDRLLFLDPAVDGAAGCSGGAQQLACPRDCSGVGLCTSAGRCSCPCGLGGRDCAMQLPVRELGGLQGIVEGDSSEKGGLSAFGDPAPDAYFALTLPLNTTGLTLSTCHARTELDTRLFLLAGCLAGSELMGVLAQNDDDPRFVIDGVGLLRGCSTIRTDTVRGGGRFYIMLGGYECGR